MRSNVSGQLGPDHAGSPKRDTYQLLIEGEMQVRVNHPRWSHPSGYLAVRQMLSMLRSKHHRRPFVRVWSDWEAKHDDYLRR